MRHQSYLNTATRIISTFQGAEPLAMHLKKFFAADKKYGSKDRKQIASLCYNYYRLGKAELNIPIEERIILAAFLCEQSSSEFLQALKPEWAAQVTATVVEKLKIVAVPALITAIFPWQDELSEGIVPSLFNISFLQQPQLFLRVRPGKKTTVLEKLQGSGIDYELVGEHTIALPNATRIGDLLEPDKEVVVQDLNSQQVLNSVKAGMFPAEPRAWDCCAASGGKSILLYDLLEGRVDLTVSDIRESILLNLQKRFTVAGIRNYRQLVADLSRRDQTLGMDPFQVIICDAPCTGSGTWSRTPEQAYYFKPAAIDDYAQRQQQIVSNAIPQLEKGGLFFYITCSVFKKENEQIVDFIKEKFHLQVLQMELLKGYDKKADTMFVAVCSA